MKRLWSRKGRRDKAQDLFFAQAASGQVGGDRPHRAEVENDLFWNELCRNGLASMLDTNRVRMAEQVNRAVFRHLADGCPSEIGIGWRMKATISVDRRVSDGAEGAQFTQALAKHVKEPLRLLL